MWNEEDFLPLSALQHYVFCPRQCALIHAEGVWADNRYTAEGRSLHGKTSRFRVETRGDVRTVYALPLQSVALGVSGIADVVEFHRDEGGVVVFGWRGRWRPFPVEFKRGRPKPHRADEVQLCAQAICLEEMLGCRIERGALFYGRTRRRHEVIFDEPLRRLTFEAAEGLHRLLRSGKIPKPVPSRACRLCSLVDLCMPFVVSDRSAQEYVDWILEAGEGKDETSA